MKAWQERRDMPAVIASVYGTKDRRFRRYQLGGRTLPSATVSPAITGVSIYNAYGNVSICLRIMSKKYDEEFKAGAFTDRRPPDQPRPQLQASPPNLQRSRQLSRYRRHPESAPRPNMRAGPDLPHPRRRTAPHLAGRRLCKFDDDGLSTTDFPKVSPHDLRHTAASLAISAGANVKAVQTMLGHASAAMTLDTYADLFPDDLEVVADVLERQRAAALEQIHVSADRG